MLSERDAARGLADKEADTKTANDGSWTVCEITPLAEVPNDTIIDILMKDIGHLKTRNQTSYDFCLECGVEVHSSIARIYYRGCIVEILKKIREYHGLRLMRHSFWGDSTKSNDSHCYAYTITNGDSLMTIFCNCVYFGHLSPKYDIAKADINTLIDKGVYTDAFDILWEDIEATQQDTVKIQYTIRKYFGDPNDSPLSLSPFYY